MKRLLVLSVFISSFCWGISPHEFNEALLEGVKEDIKQDRFSDPTVKPRPDTTRKPASFERHEEFDIQEYRRKNKVNGLHEKW